MPRALVHVVLALSLLFVAAGCGPKWTVVKQASPNPFTPQSTFHVSPPTFENLHVGQYTEEQYLATKEPQTQETFKGDKTGMVDGYMAGFSEEKEALQMVNGGKFVVRPNITFIEPGYYAVMASAPTEVMVDVKVYDDKQQVLLEEFTITARAAADMYRPSSGQRMRNAAEDLGKLTAKYLKKRAGLD